MTLNQTGMVWVVLAAALLLCAQAGFAVMHAGLLRPKNTVNVAASKLIDVATACLVTWICGFGIMFGESLGGWLGSSGFFLGGPAATHPGALASFVLHALLCATVATIVSGALAERMSFRGQLITAGIVAALLFPIFGHWAWASAGGKPTGWLARSGFVDVAGATTVHSLAGWIALAGLLTVGNRSGRYARSGKPVPLTGSSVTLAAVGAILVCVGWLGATTGSAADSLESIPTLVLATLLAAGAGATTAVVGALFRRGGRGLVELDTTLRGMLAGLAAVSVGPHIFGPSQALVAGALAGGVMIAVELLLARLRIDDAVGAVPAHLGGGVTGTLAVALLGDPALLGTGLHPLAQLAVQLEGVVVCAAWGFGATFLLFKAIGLVARLRVAPDEEFIGLNVSEHGASTELMDLMDALEETARHETPYVRGEPFSEVANLSFGPDGLLARGNPAASAIFGYGERELRRVSVLSLFSPEPPDLDTLRADLDESPREVRGLRRTGEEFPMEVSLVRGDPSTGELDALALKDITARKETEEGFTRLQQQIRRRLERELEETRVVPGGGASADVELPGGDVSLALPNARGPDWFGWFHEPAAKGLTVYAGEITTEVRGAASLLSSVLSSGGYESEYTHGLLLGDSRYSPERQMRNLAEVINRIVMQEGRGELTMSIVFAHVDLTTGNTIVASAGRRARALLKSGSVVKEIGGGGAKLGAGTEFQLDLTTQALASGDVLLLYGDGLVDTVTPDGSMLRLTELKKVLAQRSSASEIVDDIVARARAVWKDPPSTHPVLVFQWRP